MVLAKATPVASGLNSLKTGRSRFPRSHPATQSSAIARTRLSTRDAHDLEKPVPEGQFVRMDRHLPISRVINLIPVESQRLWTVDESEARRRLLASDAGEVLGIDGSFAIVAQEGERVLLARSL